ncbi:MFS transporter [Sphingomonas sp. NFR15]|uniref:MFS transporter n=1 Tax=Sphingomonas sp. NFR15 TaxID=1566282 RepID=UPI0015A4AE56|nr:MFS transporter [Sphingomonas sp. NFR15]
MNTTATSQAFRGVFLSVAPAMFLGTLDETIISTALPAIAAALHDFTSVSWIVTSYLLAATVAAPIYGRIGDAVGRKTALLGALAMFIAGSLGCGVAPDLTTLVVARAVQGLGGGGLMTLSQSLIGEAVAPKDRGRFQGWFGALFALASTIGPLLGGVLSEHAGWRWIFWINVPLGLGATAAAWAMSAEKGAGKFIFDIVGTLTFAAGTICLLLGLMLGHQLGWTSAEVLTLGAIGVVAFAALLPIERRVTAPLISPGLLQQPIVWRLTLVTGLFAATLFAAVVQVPLFLQLALGMSPSMAGLLLIPFTLAQVIVSTWTGLRISVTGLPRGPLVWGLALAALGFAVLAATVQHGGWAIGCASILFGLGLGTTMPAAQTMVQWSGGKARLGVATATLSFARSIGGVFGTAITSAILIGVLEYRVPGAVLLIEAKFSGVGSAGVGSAALPADDVLAAFRWVFVLLALIAGAGAAIAASVPAVDLDDPEPEAAL